MNAYVYNLSEEIKKDMKALFIHSVKLYKYADQYYTDSLSVEIWRTQYLRYFDEILVVGRECTATKEMAESLSLVSCEGVSFSNLPFKQLYTAAIYARRTLKAYIEDAIRQCDCVILRVPYSLSGMVIDLCKKHGKPFMVEVVGCVWDVYTHLNLIGQLLAPFATLQMRSAVRKAPFAMYVTREFLQKRYPCSGKTAACSDVKIQSAGEDIIARRLEICRNFSYERPVRLTTVGAVNVRYKGQEYVLRAMAALKKEGRRFRYTIVGGGDSSRLQGITASLGLEDDVVFTGSLPHDRVLAALDETDIYVHPSVTEGLPRSVLEAMSRGCPVLGCAAGGTPEIVPPENRFAKKDVQGLQRLLVSYSPEKMEREALRNIQISEQYTQDKLTAVRDRFFRELIQRVNEAKE